MSIIDDLTAASQVRNLREEDRAQLTAVCGEFYEIDGTVFDLGRVFVDVTGGRWQWTGCRDGRGVPLMDFLKHPSDPGMSAAERQPVPLDEVQRWHGPLLPERAQLTAADYRRALLAAPTPREVFGGAA
ncbi:phiSA1p31-related protein [Streptomyces sp. NPDC051173]|uniref:phiSA1p31-related protein n=1 Tax=Streptomyces sp. NPDC051173 TaxID=3155164 RepID=UPI00344D8DA4